MKKKQTKFSLNIAILLTTLLVSLFPVYVLLAEKENLKILLTGYSNNFLVIYALVGGVGVGYYLAQQIKERSLTSKALVFIPVVFVVATLLYALYAFAGLSKWNS